MFCPCFFGAAVPPLLFAFYVSEQLELQARTRHSDARFASSGVSDAGSSNKANSGEEGGQFSNNLLQRSSTQAALDEGEEEEEQSSPATASSQPLDVVQILVS